MSSKQRSGRLTINIWCIFLAHFFYTCYPCILCTIHSHSLHHLSWHIPCIFFAQSLHIPWTIYEHPLHIPRTFFETFLHIPCTFNANSLHISSTCLVGTSLAHYLHTLCTLYVSCTFFTHIMHICCTSFTQSKHVLCTCIA